MEPFGRQPPRFVPTLTDVVPQGLPLHKAEPQEPVLEDRLEAAFAPRTPAMPAMPDKPWESAAGMPPALHEHAVEPVVDALPVSAAEPVLTAFAPADLPSSQPEPVLADAAPDWLQEDTAPADAGYADMPLELDLPEPAADAAPAPAWDAAALHAMLVERILARVQPQLEAHLREVVADVVSLHTQAMARSLHGAVEDVVQHAVAEAIAQEQIQAQLGIQAQL